MAIFIRVDGKQETVRPANGRTFSLEEMQLLIGGFIQIVRSSEPDMWIVCDECGKVINPPKPVNVVASTHWMGLDYGDMLVGEILVGTAQEIGMNGEDDDVYELEEDEVKIMDDLKKLYDEGKL